MLNFLESEREKGKFSSQPVANPRGQHKIMSVTENTSTGSLKANTSLRTSHQPGHGAQSPFDSKPSAKFIPPFPPPVPPVQPNSVTSPDSNQTPHLPRAPYPNRLAPARKAQLFKDIRKVFKNVHINIPFLTAIQQVPAYSRFLKNLSTIKRTTQVCCNVFIATSVLNSGGGVKVW